MVRNTWRSKVIPLTTKKMGMRNPKPMASSLAFTRSESWPSANRLHADAGGERPEEHVEAKFVGQ